MNTLLTRKIVRQFNPAFAGPARGWTGLLIAGVLGAAIFLTGVAPADAARVPKGKSRMVTAKQKEAVDQLLRMSGLRRQVENQTSTNLAQEWQLSLMKVKETDIGIVRSLYAGVYNQEDFYQTLVTTYGKHFNPKHLRAAKVWFKSPVGSKALDLERKAAGVEPANRERFIIKKYKEEKPDKKRILLIKRLEKARQISKFDITTSRASLRLLIPLGKFLATPDLDKLEKEVVDQFQKPLQERVQLTLLYTYDTLSGDELAKLVKFAESPAGTWYYRTYQKGYMEALSYLGSRASGKLALLLEGGRKGQDMDQLAREIFRPGFRFLFVQKRDPFVPMKKASSVGQAKVAKLLEVVPEKIKQAAAEKKPRLQKFGPELDALATIPYELYQRLKETNPSLYSDLEYFSGLFKDKRELRAMADQEYLDTVAFYKELIDKANQYQGETVLTPLQLDYEKLKVSGVIWDGFGTLALVETPDAAGHTVKKGELFGPNFGVVQSIDQQKLVILERQWDYQGNVLKTTRELELFAQKEGSSDSQPTNK